MKNIETIAKKESAAKPDDRWTYQVFLVLYLNLGFEMLRDPVMPKDVIDELDTCYAKATEVKKKKATRRTTRSKLQEEEKEETVDDPHWLEVVTDILLSLLSRDSHLLRTVVVSVWSMLAEHLTVDVLQQVLDVIDPLKKENPLMNVDEDEDSGEEEDEEGEVSGEEEDNEGEGGEDEEEADNEDEDDDMEDEDMNDEEETVTDKLRMRIHEALGDSAALTDTVCPFLPFLEKKSLEIFKINFRFYPFDCCRNLLTWMTFRTVRWSLWTRLLHRLSKSFDNRVRLLVVAKLPNSPKTRRH